jgi:REP element-mobilizing transposase RayT
VATYLGEIFHELAGQRESKIVEGHICPDHIHMLIEIPPKYAVTEVVGYIKGGPLKTQNLALNSVLKKPWNSLILYTTRN